jgi:hypothetical protein
MDDVWLLVGNSLILHWLNSSVAELRGIQIDCLPVGSTAVVKDEA